MKTFTGITEALTTTVVRSYPSEICVEAFLHGRYVGHVRLRRADVALGGERAFLVADAFVREDSRRQGVASAMYERAAREAARYDAVMISAHDSRSEAAQALWHSFARSRMAYRMRDFNVDVWRRGA